MKPLAKELIARFGAFADVVSADPEPLAEVTGVDDNAITALKFVQAAVVRLVRR